MSRGGLNWHPATTWPSSDCGSKYQNWPRKRRQKAPRGMRPSVLLSRSIRKAYHCAHWNLFTVTGKHFHGFEKALDFRNEIRYLDSDWRGGGWDEREDIEYSPNENPNGGQEGCEKPRRPSSKYKGQQCYCYIRQALAKFRKLWKYWTSIKTKKHTAHNRSLVKQWLDRWCLITIWFLYLVHIRLHMNFRKLWTS